MATTLRLPDDLDATIAAIAARDHTSKHATVIDCIRRGIAARDAERVAATNAMLDQFAGRSDGGSLTREQVMATIDEVRAERDADYDRILARTEPTA